MDMNDINTVLKSLGAIEARLTNIEKYQEKHIDRLDERLTAVEARVSVSPTFAAAEEKYASKTTQNIVYTMVTLIVVAVFGALIALVVK